MTEPPQAPPPGLTVDGYTLLTRIGEGGMGVVHLARRGDGPRVALKVLRPHIIGDDEIRARLAREVNSLRRIRSPRVAAIVDADPWGVVPYVATRYVPGLALHDHVAEEGPVEGADLVHLAAMLAEGLSAVHACAVVHRDVKPANVLMEGRNPVLIDFGLARVADDPKLTHTGWLLGTPGYLAPEILLGDEATNASDVHSWAATVAYAGLGRPPFGRGPGMAIMDRVRRGEHDLRGLPAPLGKLLDKALSPDPLERPTVPELLCELRSAPVPAAPAGVSPSDPATQDPFTMPMAATARREWAAPTDHRSPGADEPRISEHGPTSTRPLPSHAPSTPGPRLEPGQPDPQRPPSPRPPPLGLRLRRGSLFVALALTGGAAAAAYPVLGTSALLMLAWLLRSGSLAGTGADNRRLLRGRKWYDQAQILIATPWHLLQSIPGALVLAVWSAGVGLAGALLAYAFAVDLPVVMGVAGVMFAASLGVGPGAPRVRGPLSRVVNPVANSVVGWPLALVLLLIVAGIVGSIAQTGPDWAPFAEGPFGLG